MTGTLFVYGLGYCGLAAARRLRAAGWRVAGTTRDATRAHALAAEGIAAGSIAAGGIAAGAIGAVPAPADGAAGAGAAGATHVLSTVPPDASGDPVLVACGAALAAAAPRLRWVGYLSATGVYGDRGGGPVDEDSELRPTGARGARRVAAERGWLALWREHGVPVHVFRLAGIYGPGRSALDAVRGGRARRIVKPGQVFSRIHVDDIVGVLAASMAAPRPGLVCNVCDDEAAPPQDVVAYACALLGRPPPPEIPIAEAALGAAARSFYRDSKRVSNARMKRLPGVALRYPDYRAGLRALLAAGA